jgi:hypothetical protein
MPLSHLSQPRNLLDFGLGKMMPMGDKNAKIKGE